MSAPGEAKGYPAYCPACGATLSGASSAVPIEDPATEDGGTLDGGSGVGSDGGRLRIAG